jgi:hypothetical protein
MQRLLYQAAINDDVWFHRNYIASYTKYYIRISIERVTIPKYPYSTCCVTS